jgi:hypothetical protein
MANGPGDHETDKTDSGKSSPCIRGPDEKRARSIPSMPSSTIAPVRCGDTPDQPRFPHRRVAARYKQSRQPLPLAERSVRRVRFALAPLPTQQATCKVNEHPTALRSCLKTTSTGKTTTPGLSRYNGATTSSERKTDASDSLDNIKYSRGRKLWGRIFALF